MTVEIDLNKVYTVTAYARKLSTDKRKVFTTQVYRMIEQNKVNSLKVNGITLVLDAPKVIKG